MKNDMKEILLSEEQIQTKVKELAAQISKDYAGKDPVFIGVLKGVVVFFADITVSAVSRLSLPTHPFFPARAAYAECETALFQNFLSRGWRPFRRSADSRTTPRMRGR